MPHVPQALGNEELFREAVSTLFCCVIVSWHASVGYLNKSEKTKVYKMRAGT